MASAGMVGPAAQTRSHLPGDSAEREAAEPQVLRDNGEKAAAAVSGCEERGDEEQRPGPPAAGEWVPGCGRGSGPLWLLTRLESALTWRSPGYSVGLFICANAVFWFLALTPWRLYSLVALCFLLLAVLEKVKLLTLFIMKGWKSSRSLSESWKVTDDKPEGMPRLNQYMTESWMSCTAFFEEMFHFKKQNPGKFCLLVCSLCTFCAVVGRYIPGAVVSYCLLLCALLWPLVTSYDLGHRVYSRIEPLLQRLDFGLKDCVLRIQKRRSMRQKELAERKAEDESEADTSALCPKVSISGLGKELSISDTEPSEISWTENGTFNLSGGHTPQTDASDDLDRPSDHEEVFARDLPEFPSIETGNKGTIDDDDDDLSIGIPTPPIPTLEPYDAGSCQEGIHAGSLLAGHLLNLSEEQTFNLISTVASDVIAAAVSSAVKGQLQSAEPVPAPAPQLNSSDETDTEEADDFELLDESELEQIESELGLDQGQAANQRQAKDGKSGFLSNLLGGH
ncbi:reticulophagy regulator 1 isoform X1 [Callorhinchus milii]|uniref:reticulophagy regulator 1 isoform X1 n=1 Tax=Callorhinchus milii TaxID=7868 RepID=UPI001C3F58A9|nr:reticulophagy regulator 1 isoform X1 [Callorhinchus milii]